MKQNRIINWTWTWSCCRRSGHPGYQSWWPGSTPWGRSNPWRWGKSVSRRVPSIINKSIPWSLRHRSTWCRHTRRLRFSYWPWGSWRPVRWWVFRPWRRWVCSSSFCRAGWGLRGCSCLGNGERYIFRGGPRSLWGSCRLSLSSACGVIVWWLNNLKYQLVRYCGLLYAGS